MRFSKYEKARLIGARALQISHGAPFLLDFSEEDLKKNKFNPVELARLEFEAGKINMDVLRQLPKREAVQE